MRTDKGAFRLTSIFLLPFSLAFFAKLFSSWKLAESEKGRKPAIHVRRTGLTESSSFNRFLFSNHTFSKRTGRKFPTSKNKVT